MIFIKGDDQKVNFVHYMPFDSEHGMGKTREQLELEGILVESIPEPEPITDKIPVLHYSLETKELWYEYDSIPFSNSIERQLQEIQEALNILLGED